MEQETKEQGKARKIYTINSIWVGTFLGGPLTAGYLIAENFKTLGQKEKVIPTWTITFTATVIIFGGIFVIPDLEKIPRQLIPLIYTAVAYYIVNQIQGEKIKAYIIETGKAFSVWRSLGIGLIWLIITSIPIFIIAFLITPTIPETTKSYGQLKHEIYYDKSDLSESEVDRIAKVMTESTFFDNDQQKSILLAKDNSGYIISIPLIKDSWNDIELINFFNQLRIDVQTEFNGKKVVINLCSDEDIYEIKKTLE